MKTDKTLPVPFLISCAMALVILCGSLVPGAWAKPPELMTYQGFLVDANGVPLAMDKPANYPVIFRIYDSAISGELKWSEQQIVTVDKGNFSVMLGEGTPFNSEPRPALISTVFAGADDQRYISVAPTIGNETAEILPRLRLLPAPYAFQATSASYIADPAGASVLAYSGGKVTAQGDFTASGIIDGTIRGNISGNVSGTITGDGSGLGGVVKLTGGNTIAGNQQINGHVGIGVEPSSEVGKLSVWGGVRARGGIPGVGGVNDRGYAFSGSGGDNDSGMYSNGGGRLQFFTDGVERIRIAGGNVGIGQTSPSSKLDVNGEIKATSLTVSGEFTAGSFSAATVGANFMTTTTLSASALLTAPVINSTVISAAVVNGVKAPQSFTLGAQGILGSFRTLEIDTEDLLGDANGGRIKILLRNHGDKTVRMISYEFYAENDTDNFGQAGRWGWSIDSYGTERGFLLGSGNPNHRYDIGAAWNWMWLKNYKDQVVNGGNHGPAEGPADRYKFWLLLAPQITATVIVYDH